MTKIRTRLIDFSSKSEELGTTILGDTRYGISSAAVGAVDASSIPPNAAKPAAGPGWVFREVWAINGPFEAEWMSAFNTEICAHPPPPNDAPFFKKCDASAKFFVVLDDNDGPDDQCGDDINPCVRNVKPKPNKPKPRSLIGKAILPRPEKDESEDIEKGCCLGAR
jgi:hypothetical protein